MATHKGVAWYHSGTPDSEQVSILEPPDSMIQVRGNQNDTHYLSHIIEEAKITASGGEFGNVCILKLFIFSEIIL